MSLPAIGRQLLVGVASIGVVTACAVSPAPPTRVGTVGEENGVRLRIELDEPTLTAGKPAGATVTITNTGSDPVTWVVGSCRFEAHLGGSAGTWRVGRIWAEPDADRIKHEILEAAQARDGIAIGFRPDALTARVEPGGPPVVCRDVGESMTLAPGESTVQHQAWSGLADRTRAAPPPGPVVLIGRVDGLARGGRGDEPGFSVSAELRTTIEGPDRSPKVHPGEAIDVALEDPEFGEWLRTRARFATNPILEFEPTEGIWRVGMEIPGQSTRRYAFVDATTGAFRGWVDEIRN